MKIGQIIRAYRKDRGLTQEEMARRLGVTAPAVNKWEKDNALPDISMLAPIARLLQVSLDELLGYREALTNEEIVAYVQNLDRELKSLPYPEVFSRAKKIMETEQARQEYRKNRTLENADAIILAFEGVPVTFNEEAL